MNFVFALFVAVMMINFGLMIYRRVEKGIVVAFTMVVYIVFVFWNPLGLDRDLLIVRGGCIFFLILVMLTLFLYKRYGSQCFGVIFFVSPWVIMTRTMGFPDDPNFGEKDFGIFVASAFNTTFSLWVFSLLFHQKIYQKIIFGIISTCLVFLFYCFSGIQEQITSIIFLPPYMIEMLLAIVSYSIIHIFFYFGEILLFFLLCYEIFFKNSKNPTIEGSNTQSNSLGKS